MIPSTPDTLAAKEKSLDPEDYAVTRNACKLCTPLGAALAFKGLRNCITLLHGSQGCSTYIRRYMISHFREPIDIASSNFTEHAAVFGGRSNLLTALDNVVRQYHPEVIAIATTCLAETIGEDVPGLLRKWHAQSALAAGVRTVFVSTPSYQGTHREGFQDALAAIVRDLVPDHTPVVVPDQALYLGPAQPLEPTSSTRSAIPPATLSATAPAPAVLSVFCGMVSPADLRLLRSIFTHAGIPAAIHSDYSQTLDAGMWSKYEPIPPGGASLAEIADMATSRAVLEFGALSLKKPSAGTLLSNRFGMPLHSLDLPIGIKLCDAFFTCLQTYSPAPLPPALGEARERLADSYVDGHKYLRGLPVLVYGEEDFALSLASFVAETGAIPSVVASGGRSGLLEQRLPQILPEWEKLGIRILNGIDFVNLEAVAREAGVRIAIGNSKGAKLARSLEIPLVRAGFPIHDRFGAARLLHLGYEGTQALFDTLINTHLQRTQESDGIGYTYF